jgi:hypothetical protein
MTAGGPSVVWPPNSLVTALYQVRAVADPNVLPRLLNFFAQQYLIPSTVCVGRRGDKLSVAIEQPGIHEHSAVLIAEKMRSLVAVKVVELDCR